MEYGGSMPPMEYGACPPALDARARIADRPLADRPATSRSIDTWARVRALGTEGVHAP